MDSERFVIDYNKLKMFDAKTLELYHQETNKRMDDLKNIESLISERAYKLFSVYYAVEIAVIGYVLTQLNNGDNVALINAGMAIVVFTTISMYYVIRVMRPHEVMPAGRAPRNLRIEANSSFFKSNPRLDRYTYIMAGELMNIQGKIEYQEKLNTARTKLTNISINFMLAGLLLAVVTFVLSITFLG